MVQILVMNSGDVGRINKLLNTHKFKIKDAPDGNVISSSRKKHVDLQHPSSSPSPVAGGHPFAFFHSVVCQDLGLEAEVKSLSEMYFGCHS